MSICGIGCVACAPTDHGSHASEGLSCGPVTPLRYFEDTDQRAPPVASDEWRDVMHINGRRLNPKQTLTHFSVQQLDCYARAGDRFSNYLAALSRLGIVTADDTPTADRFPAAETLAFLDEATRPGVCPRTAGQSGSIYRCAGIIPEAQYVRGAVCRRHPAESLCERGAEAWFRDAGNNGYMWGSLMAASSR